MHTKPKVALIHDWLNGFRGGERCLEQMCLLFPEADIFTLFYEPGTVSQEIESHKITTSFLNNFPGKKRYYRHLLPLFPLAIERFNLNDYDLIISSSHCAAKGVIPGPDSVHITYCYTPMRYIWDKYDDYFGGKTIEPLLYPLIHYLRSWDVLSANRVDHFIGISEFIRERIRRYYRRDSVCVYPPVDTETFVPDSSKQPEDFYLVASAFAPYKRLDLAIQACNALDAPLYVVGGGQDAKNLKTLAGPKTKFLGRVPLNELVSLFQSTKALLFPGEEDFGITPLEVNACGRPVVALAKGGALETLTPRTAIFFSEPTVEHLASAIEEFECRTFSPTACRENALRFSTERFVGEFSNFVNETLTRRQLRAEETAQAPEKSHPDATL